MLKLCFSVSWIMQTLFSIIYRNTFKTMTQRVQNATASFVHRKYVKETDLFTLNWLTIRKCMEFCIAKLAFKAPDFDGWPKCLSLFLTATKNLRSLRSTFMKYNIISWKTRVPSTFEYTASQAFNSLFLQCRSTTNYIKFCSEAKEILKD